MPSTSEDLIKAIEIICSTTPDYYVEQTDLSRLCRNIAAEDLFAPISYPESDRSLMDGVAYNSRTADLSKPLRIIDHLAAGKNSTKTINGNKCIRVSTGANIPTGVDTVIPIEDLSVSGTRVQVNSTSQSRSFIEPKGSRFTQGDIILSKGMTIDPWHVEILASMRINTVKTVRPPRFGILSTGSEISGLFSSRESVMNSNYYALSALMKHLNIPYSYIGVAPDDKKELAHQIKKGLESFDAIVTFGGTAKGRYDLIKSVITSSLKGKIVIDKIKASPGRTFRLAKVKDKVIFVLPGTPSAALACSELFIVTWLMQYYKKDWINMVQKCRSGFTVTKKAGFYKPIPCWASVQDGVLVAVPKTTENTNSNIAIVSSAVLLVPPDVEILEKGDICEILLTSM